MNHESLVTYSMSMSSCFTVRAVTLPNEQGSLFLSGPIHHVLYFKLLLPSEGVKKAKGSKKNIVNRSTLYHSTSTGSLNLLIARRKITAATILSFDLSVHPLTVYGKFKKTLSCIDQVRITSFHCQLSKRNRNWPAPQQPQHRLLTVKNYSVYSSFELKNRNPNHGFLSEICRQFRAHN